jgi:hypothetical protein
MKIKVFMKCSMVLLVLLICIGQPVYAQICDSRLQPDDNKTIQYRARKNRCEGFYKTIVAAPGELAVVGVTDGNFRFELDAKELITIAAPLVNNQAVSIRAVGIPLNMYYRLDAQLAPGQTLAWPVADVLYPMKLASENIGVLGWIGTEENKTYIPVMATAKIASVAQDGKIRLTVRASVDVTNVQWRSGPVQQGKTAGLSDWNKPPKTSYWAGEPIVIILPASTTGELYVEVAAQKQGTDEWLNALPIRVVVRR